MRYLLLIMMFFFSLNEAVAKQLTIKGRLLDESQKPISRAFVKINQNKIHTDISGRFELDVNSEQIYQLSIQAAGYYPSIHSYSHSELNNQNLTIADITLVTKKDKRVMLAFGGDVMMGRRYYKPYFGDEVLIRPDNKLADSKAIVEHIKPYMAIADYAAVNLETQIATKKPPQRAPKSVTFYSQPEILDALTWAGIDYVTLGNNHTYDYLDSGLHSTLTALNQSSLGYSGAGINEAESLKAHHQNINNLELAMLGYVGWEGSSKPKQTATNHHGGAAYGSMDNILSSVKREVSANKTPIVQYHGSQEYANEPTGVTEQRLKSALDQGAALAIAHHPHVSQGIELYNGKLIAYSMGNFIFDQNFSATQHSFMLYVWLDEGQFHRAEIVPIYVKGYKPTPAVGIQRNTIMRRLKSLSQKRNTFITPSGGHGVITAKNSSPKKALMQSTINMPEGEKIVPLYNLPWSSELKNILLPTQSSSSDNKVQYRLGTNLINNHDFENFSPFNSPERGFLFDRTSSVINNFGLSGQHSFGLSLSPLTTQLFGMQSFRRVYQKSSPMTLKANVQLSHPVKVNFYWQGRKTRQKLFDAFNNSPKHLIGSKTFSGKEKWQAVEIDFNSPRIGYKSYRILVEFINENNQAIKIDIDDFSLIEWQTAFSSQPSPMNHKLINEQATFLGVNSKTEKSVTIEYTVNETKRVE